MWEWQPNRLALPPAGYVLPQPCGITSFIEPARCQSHDGLGRIHLTGLEVEAVQFEEENADYKSRPLVAIDKWMIADDAGSVTRGHFDDVRVAGIGIVLAGARQRGLKKPPIAQAHTAAMERQEPVVDREGIAFIDQSGSFFFTLFLYLERACSVLR